MWEVYVSRLGNSALICILCERRGQPDRVVRSPRPHQAGHRRFRPQGRRIYCASMWVRLANDHDLEVIAGVDAVAGVDPDRIRTLVSQSIADSGCWIAGYGDLPEGYLVLLRRHFFGRDFVSLVAVKSSARRRGLASILFQAAESSATTRQLFTSTNQSNRPMQALLEARGYQKAGVIDHLDIDDPEVVFVRYVN